MAGTVCCGCERCCYCLLLPALAHASYGLCVLFLRVLGTGREFGFVNIAILVGHDAL